MSGMSGPELHDDSPGPAGRRPDGPRPASHDELRLGLMDAGRQLHATTVDPARFPAARDTIARYCFSELLPHLEADESWLMAARDSPETRLLADAMRTEARAMTAAAHELAHAQEPVQAVAATRVLHALLAAHAHHEDLLAHTRPTVEGGRGP